MGICYWYKNVFVGFHTQGPLPHICTSKRTKEKRLAYMSMLMSNITYITHHGKILYITSDYFDYINRSLFLWKKSIIVQS